MEFVIFAKMIVKVLIVLNIKIGVKKKVNRSTKIVQNLNMINLKNNLGNSLKNFPKIIIWTIKQ